MPDFDSYVICTSPRSGSTLLCKLLAATGVSGQPGSYFHRPSIADWLADHNITPDPSASESGTLARIFQAVIAKGSRNTGLFGLRLQRHSFDFFTEKLAVLHPEGGTDLERLEAAFGRTLFIHLTRQDKVAQAVSYVKAEQTGLWHMAPDGTELERLAPPREPDYDGQEILSSYRQFKAYDLDWLAWFESQGIEPLSLTYDVLASDPVKALCDCLQRLGLDREAANGVTPGVARLADETSRVWTDRFRREQGIA